MAREVGPIRNDLNQLRADFNEMKATLADVRRMAALVENFIQPSPWFLTDTMQTRNGSAGTGRDARLEVVPFANGDDPTRAPVNNVSSRLKSMTEKICPSTICPS